MNKDITDFLKKYTNGKQNTEKVEISVIQLNRAIKVLEQETVSRESYEHEYFLRKEFEVKIDKLQRQLEEQIAKVESILSNIGDEIADLADSDAYGDYQQGFNFGLMRAVQIVDKYTTEEKAKVNKNTAEYKKDLNELKEQILKEGNTSVLKKDLLERFWEIDKAYNGRPWNLLQILANINILIGEEPCEVGTDTNVGSKMQAAPSEDTISRSQALSDYADWYGYGYRDNTFYKLLQDMPSVTPKPKAECSCDQIKWERDMAIAQLNELGYGLGEKPETGHWVLLDKCANSGYYCSKCHKKVVKEGWSDTVKKIKYCPNCGKRMIEL